MIQPENIKNKMVLLIIFIFFVSHFSTVASPGSRLQAGAAKVKITPEVPVAVLVNWPCHAVVPGPKNYYITGDWPGAASGYLERHFGHGVIAPVILGTSGDINLIYGPHMEAAAT